MSDNSINIESDLEGSASSSSERRVEHKLCHLPYESGDFESEIISPIDDYETEGVFGDPFFEKASSNYSLEILLSAKVSGETDVSPCID